MTNIIAYVPALHRGYLNFFTKNKGKLFLLGQDLILDYPRMERDIRALTAEEIKMALEPFCLFKSIEIITKDNLKELLTDSDFVMPDEDISHEFAETYLNDKKIKFESVFLRWDKHSTLKNKEQVNPDRQISNKELDLELMKRALVEAEKSSDWWRQIGALIVKDQKILLIGHNQAMPSEGIHNIVGDPRSNFDYGISFELSKFIHAEAGLIARSAKEGISLDGTSIYVTTFPCPVCAKSIAVSGIKKVYYKEGYALLDAEDILKQFEIEIIKVEV